MALIGGYSVINRTRTRSFGGGISFNYLECFTPSGVARNSYLAWGCSFCSIPVGYSHPMSWVMARKPGGIASLKQLKSSGVITESVLARALNIAASLDASIVETQTILALIVALVADIQASGNVTDANMAIILLLESSISSTGTFTTVQLGNILGLVSYLSASGQLSNSITTLVNMSAELGESVNPLSPTALAEAVWNYLQANPTTTGSMKEVLEKAKQSADNAFAVST